MLTKVSLTAIGGGAYNFTKIASANLRQKNDPWNSALGGFVAGSVIGMTRTLPCIQFTHFPYWPAKILPIGTSRLPLPHWERKKTA